VGQLIAANDNDFVVDCPEAIGEMTSDLTKIRQALLNLLGNAAKFTQSGTIALSVSRRMAGGRELVEFAVRDTGVGMTAAQSAKLFKPFSQVDKSIATQYGGTGLGLALTYSFATALGGEVAVRSEVGSGSTFSLLLPSTYQEVDGPAVDDPQSDASGTGRAAARSPRVLIIDDDEDLRRAMLGWLQPMGWEVTIAGSGQQGLAAAAQIEPDLVLLDVIMPNMDGWAVLNALKSQKSTQETPVILTSVIGYTDLAVMLGAVSFLIKPFDGPQLIRALRPYLGEVSSPVVMIASGAEGPRQELRKLLRRNGLPTIDRTASDWARSLIRPAVVILLIPATADNPPDTIESLALDPDWQDASVLAIVDGVLSERECASLTRGARSLLYKDRYSAEDLVSLVRSMIAEAQSLAPEGLPLDGGHPGQVH